MPVTRDQVLERVLEALEKDQKSELNYRLRKDDDHFQNLKDRMKEYDDIVNYLTENLK